MRPMTSGQPPRDSRNDYQRADFSNFFGDNPKPYLMSAYDQYGRENFALPEAYLGYSPYMTNVMITLITQEHMWPAQVLPYRETQDTSSIQWNEYHFNNTLLGPVPEEGVSRLVSQQMSERRDHYIRYGLAMILEHGFMNTEKGRLCYTMNLQQIRNAVLETIYLGVLESLLHCKTVDEMWNERYGGNVRTATLARKALMMEVEDWATIQKTPHGWDLLDSRCKRYLRAKGVQPDTWIVPEGMKPYVTQVRRENYVYALAGPDGPKNFDSARNGRSEDTTLDARNDCKIFEVKSFELPDVAEPVDVTRRVRSIGEFFLMQPEQTYGQETRYDSSHRNIAIYDEDVDAFVEITLRDAISNDAYFESSDDDGSKGYPRISRQSGTRRRVSPELPEDQWTNDDDDNTVSLLGDLPRSDEQGKDEAKTQNVSLSDTTSIRFASSFFAADDQACFSRCFGREIPSLLRNMDNTQKITTTTDSARTEVELFQQTLDAMWSYVLDSDPVKFTSKVHGFYAHSDNAYSLWMFAHSIAWDGSRNGEIGEPVCKYSKALIEAYTALHRGQDIPNPPRWCDRSITMLTRAIMYALLRTRPALTTILEHVKDICDKNGAMMSTSADGQRRQRIPYAAISCTVLSFDTVRTAVGLWCTDVADVYVSSNFRALLEVATFFAINVHTALSGPSASSASSLCDGMSIMLRSPIGYDSYRGVCRLAESGEPIYEPEACANIVRNYDTLHQIAQPLFSSSPLHALTDSFFGPCVLNHNSTGNIHVNVDAVIENSSNIDDDDDDDDGIKLYEIETSALRTQIVDIEEMSLCVELDVRAPSTPWTTETSSFEMLSQMSSQPAWYSMHEEIRKFSDGMAFFTREQFEDYARRWGESWMRMTRMCDTYGYNGNASTKIWTTGSHLSRLWWGLCRVYLLTIDYILSQQSQFDFTQQDRDSIQTIRNFRTLSDLRLILITAIDLNTGDMKDWNSDSFAKAASDLLLACAPRLSDYYQLLFEYSNTRNPATTSATSGTSPQLPHPGLHPGHDDADPEFDETSFLHGTLFLETLRFMKEDGGDLESKTFLQSNKRLSNFVILIPKGSRFRVNIPEKTPLTGCDEVKVTELRKPLGDIRTPFRAPSGMGSKNSECMFYRLHPTEKRFDEDKGIFYHYILQMYKHHSGEAATKTIDEFRDLLLKKAFKNADGAVAAYSDGADSSRGIPLMHMATRTRLSESTRTHHELCSASCSLAISDRVQQAKTRLVARPHELAIFVMFVTMEFSRETLWAIVDCNKLFPFGYLLLRPYQTYQMCAAILTKAGKETGETLIGHYDFQLSDDVVRKMHYGNFTIYQKSVVYNNKNVLPVTDIVSAAYLGGGGSIFARASPENGTMPDAGMHGESAPSLYACIIGLDEIIKDNPIDVNGAYEDHTGLASMKARHYSTCEEYKLLYSWAPSEGIKRATTPPPEIWIESV
ncbi:hypothetical protein CYMTET_26601 [Cymbomonas tetramitiformis]|uniref:Uncharacterized protein n=1 Tax=Cymbomonas tetramitiformis TaxID=36881 RepID=A0AAE0KY00_9CHLO|nr:hypothetical protein CYMTET_26601 [Cymbomonas tetramitiformis]